MERPTAPLLRRRLHFGQHVDDPRPWSCTSFNNRNTSNIERQHWSVSATLNGHILVLSYRDSGEVVSVVSRTQCSCGRVPDSLTLDTKRKWHYMSAYPWRYCIIFSPCHCTLRTRSMSWSGLHVWFHKSCMFPQKPRT